MAKGLRNTRALQRRLAAPDNALLTASNVIRREVRALIQEGFDTRTDPIGRKWAPRKDRRAHPLLEETGAMRRGWVVRKRGTDTVLSNRVPYTGFHQNGTGRMPARKMIPDAALSPRWRARIGKVLSKALQDYWSKGVVVRAE